MTDADLALRNRTYAFVVAEGRMPHAEELGLRDDVLAGWRRLHAAGSAAGRSWYGNCAWDAFGICAALHADGRIEYGDIAVEVRDGRPDDESLVFHCAVPARHWWDDIVYT